MLLCGMFSSDPEGPEDSVRRGHHCNLDSQEKEGSSEEKTGTPLHQLLFDHVICKNLQIIQQPTINQTLAVGKGQTKEKCTKERTEKDKTRVIFKLQGS